MGRHHLFWLRPERAASCDFVDRPCFCGQKERSTKPREQEHEILAPKTTFDAKLRRVFSQLSGRKSQLEMEARFSHHHHYSIHVVWVEIA